MTHLAYTLLTATLLSSGVALIDRRPARERLYAALYLLACCAGTTLAGSWLMFLIHR